MLLREDGVFPWTLVVPRPQVSSEIPMGIYQWFFVTGERTEEARDGIFGVGKSHPGQVLAIQSTRTRHSAQFEMMRMYKIKVDLGDVASINDLGHLERG